jgi:hypothetical protein
MRNVGTGANGKAGKYEEKSPARESRYGTWRLAMRSQIDVSICMKWTNGTSNGRKLLREKNVWMVTPLKG